jgi:hypothetical protein
MKLVRFAQELLHFAGKEVVLLFFLCERMFAITVNCVITSILIEVVFLSHWKLSLFALSMFPFITFSVL